MTHTLVMAFYGVGVLARRDEGWRGRGGGVKECRGRQLSPHSEEKS